jgi:D-amino-acid dehydrogenase
MRVIVLGAGIIGVTTAYFLAKQGAEVVVLDRQRAPGMETSFANAGELSYGMTSPWAAPGIPLKAIKWLFMRHRPLFIWPLMSPAMWRWCAQMLMNCNEKSYAINKGRMVRISNYSRDSLTELMAELPIDFDQRELGTLQLFRKQKQVDGSKADQDVLAEFDSPFELLDRDGCIAAEPGLVHVADKFVGGLCDGAGPDRWCRHDRRASDGGSLCLRHGTLCANPAEDHRYPAADLPDQGVFDHHADHGS